MIKRQKKITETEPLLSEMGKPCNATVLRVSHNPFSFPTRYLECKLSLPYGGYLTGSVSHSPYTISGTNDNKCSQGHRFTFCNIKNKLKALSNSVYFCVFCSWEYVCVIYIQL